MKIKSSIALCLTALFIVSSAVHAKDAPPGKYFLSVANVYESSPREMVFIVGGTDSLRGWGGQTVCKSVASLKKLLSGFPRGSTLDWYPSDCDGDVHRGQFKFLKDDDVEDLKAICAKAGIKFTIHPAG